MPRAASAAASAVVVATGLLLLATQALAARSYEAQITGLSEPSGIAVDRDDQVWIGDSGTITEYGAYPSLAVLRTADGRSAWGNFANNMFPQLAYDDAASRLLAATSENGPRWVSFFEPSGAFIGHWEFGIFGRDSVAVDNSTTGRVYVALRPEDRVEAFDTSQQPFDFQTTASYISAGNALTGTPEGPFGEPTALATGPAGELFVLDQAKQLVDEFAPTGEFLRAFTDAAVPGGFSANLTGIAVDPTNGDLLLVDSGNRVVDEFDSSGNYLGQITGAGTPGGPLPEYRRFSEAIAFNSRGYLYLGVGGVGAGGDLVDIFAPAPPRPKLIYRPVADPTATSGTLEATVDPNGAGPIAECVFEYGTDTTYGSSEPCSPDPAASPPGSNFSAPTDVSASLSGLATGTTYHYRVVLHSADGEVAYGADETYAPQGVIGLRTEAASGLAETAATLNASFLGNGETTSYRFEYGTSAAYGHLTGSASVSPGSGTSESLTAHLSELTPYTTYHYRVVASNGAGTATGEDNSFTTPPGKPTAAEPSASGVFADIATLHAQLDPNGAPTSYYFLYVDQEEFVATGFAGARQSPASSLGPRRSAQPISAQVASLASNTTYHYRLLATNSAGEGTVEHTFTTLPAGASQDPCPNAHVRQQTGAAGLLDCRAYELVSAADTGGYDVASNLVPGQAPFASYPQADGRVLYGAVGGAIPGSGEPTGHGSDPYLATRTSEGWKTEYVGIPAGGTPSTAPFASPLLAADAGLDTFAFGGPEICSPCFADGTRGEPLRLPGGQLVQGMSGPAEPGPTAAPGGLIEAPLSADGKHLIFGSTSLFAPGGNDETGDASIYDRNLVTGETHVISNAPGGGPLVCLQGAGECHSPGDPAGISELAVSGDGSRVVLGQLVSTDAAGNRYYHLYMVLNDSVSIDLTPGTTSGALFAGMTADGNKVFFTTKDRLLPSQDTDESADLYEAEVGEGDATLHLLSTGTEGTGNTDECDPAANSAQEHWNTTDPEQENCGVVAIGGGGGVASGNGTVYFLSPEKLDGSSHGVQNAPNLYIVRPGEAPRYVTTLESALTAPRPAKLRHVFKTDFGSFTDATALAVDVESSDVYVLDSGADIVEKFDSDGHLVTSFGDTTPTPNGELKGTATPAGSFNETIRGRFHPTQLAVDNDPTSPSHGDLYVPDIADEAVDRFSPSGSYISSIPVSSPIAAAVDPANGDLYVASVFHEVLLFSPTGIPLSHFSTANLLQSIAVNSTGTVYVTQLAGPTSAETEAYSSSGTALGTLDSHPGQSVYVDPSNGDVYVDEASQIARFDSTGKPLETIGSPQLASSVGVAKDPEGSLYATTAGGTEVAVFKATLAPDRRVDNPLVLDSVSEANVRHTADFQLTANGSFAAFGSTLALAGNGEETAGNAEVYRYDAATEALICASCTPSGAPSAGSSGLAPDGQSLTEDGRLFFDSTDALAAADVDGLQDVYEFSEPGAGTCGPESPAFDHGTGDCLALVSAGTSRFDSGLLGATADGRDAYFFTRDSLAPQDESGDQMKIYDAREGGGFPYVFPEVQCKASDECHGPGSTAPEKPPVGSLGGEEGNLPAEPPRCRHGFVRRHGACVRPPPPPPPPPRRPQARSPPMISPRLRCTLAGALALAAVLAFASPAFASEGIESFKTTLLEAKLPHPGIYRAGIVQAPPSEEGFTIETPTGAELPIEIYGYTTYSEPGLSDTTLANVAPGDHVEVYGRRGFYSSKWAATEVVIAPPAAGFVLATPSGESFTIESPGGPQDTIEASPATTFKRARAVPGEYASPPTIGDLQPGDYVEVAGAKSGSTVEAVGVVILTPQVGGHPDLTTSFSLESPGSPEAAKNVVFEAPTGLFGNPRAVTLCGSAEFALDECPVNSQVGIITVRGDYEGNPEYLLGTAPIYSVVPQNDETARFAFVVPIIDVPISVPVSVRTTTDYGLRFTISDITQSTPLSAATLDLWGIPAEESHDLQRFAIGSPGNAPGCPGEEGTGCIAMPIKASIVAQPLIDNPTTCTGEAPTSTLEVQTYLDPGHRSIAHATYPPIEGCEREVFNPVVQASPTIAQTDAPSGLDLDLRSPQFLSKATAPSEIRSVSVTLPEGLTINPDAADGQSACTEAQADFASEGPAQCPDTSKIGTFTISTPALPEPLEGALYIGEPKPGDQYRLFMIASGFGINAKLIGSLRPDPMTGRLTAELPELPQAPFEEFQLHLFSGERGLLATPDFCSIYTVSAHFEPWNSTLSPQTSNQHFGLESGPGASACPGQVRPFSPTLESGTADPTAGAFSNYSLGVTRADGDQNIGHLNFVMPPGLLANLHGLTYCPDASIAAAAQSPGRAEQAAPSCPLSSLIGTSNVAAGPGSHPFHAVGKLYLAGPFQGAPLSIVVVTPALAGPYDYGTVVVRVAIHIDPLDAHVTADSEAVPEIIGGVPLRIREIHVDINRPDFIVNPTNCSELHTTAEALGDQGTAVAFTSPFFAVNCSTLPFAPRMTITQLGGHKATARAKQPSLQFNLNTQPGDANLKSVALTLPKSIHIDQAHLGNLCDRSELASDQCKGKAAIGTVIDETPLLEKPLEGLAYAVTGFSILPHVVFILGGQVTVMPEGISTTVAGGRLRTVIPVIPDVPIGHFRLSLYGGTQGYLENTESLCGSPQLSAVEIDAQNGKKLTQQVKAKTACKAKHKKPKRHTAKKRRRRGRR